MWLLVFGAVALWTVAFMAAPKGHHGLLASTVAVLASFLIMMELALKAPSSFSQMQLVAPIAFSLLLILLITRTIHQIVKQQRRGNSGHINKTLYGAAGKALTDLNPNGVVTISGETWSGESLNGLIKSGSKVYVAEVDGIHLKVWSDAPSEPEVEETK